MIQRRLLTESGWDWGDFAMNKKKHISSWHIWVLIALIFVALAVRYLTSPWYQTELLLDAIEEQDIEKIQEILGSGHDPNHPNIPPSNWWSFIETSARLPLAQACWEGNEEIIRLLIDYGATAEYQDYCGWSPLRHSLFRYEPSDEDIIPLLLQHGADPWLEEGDYNAVFAAAEMYPWKMRPEVSRVYNADVAEGITRIVALLLGDENVNVTTKNGETLLMCASKRGNLALAEYLLEQGANPMTTDNSGKSALDYAQANNHQSIVDLLHEYISEKS